MRTLLQVVSWIGIVVGGLAILGSEGDYYALVGGGLFFTQGLVALIYLNKEK